MSTRFASTRYLIVGTLKAETPLHIGGHDGLEVDNQFLTDGQGRYVIPGTLLAGALRTAWRKQQSTNGVAKAALWGGSGDDDHALQIILDDAVLKDQTPAVDVRTRTKIDEKTGAARPGLLFSTEVLAAGSEFGFQAEVDVPNGDDRRTSVGATQDNAWPDEVKQLLAILTSGFQLGALASTGFGAMRLLEPKVTSCRRDNAVDLIAAMQGNVQGEKKISDGPAGVAADTAAVALSIPWRPIGLILVADLPPGAAVDTVPLVSRRPGTDGTCVHLLIPATSIKGALRAQAE